MAVTDDAVAHLAKSCRQLEMFSLDKCHAVTDLSISSLAEHCSLLRDITLTNMSRITKHSIEALSTHCIHIHSLSVRRCEKIPAADVARSIRSGLKHLACELSTLVNGKKVARWRNKPVELLDDLEGVQKLCALESLRLVNVGISDAMFAALTRTCKTMRVLMLTEQLHIKYQSLLLIAEHWPQLEELSLVSCAQLNDAVILAIAESCVGLTLLDVSRSFAVREPAIRTIITKCVHLRSLFISSLTYVSFNVSLVGDILKSLPQLQALDISGNPLRKSNNSKNLAEAILANRGVLKELFLSDNNASYYYDYLPMDEIKNIEGLEVFNVRAKLW